MNDVTNAALAARLLKLSIDQARMALGHAASAMAGKFHECAGQSASVVQRDQVIDLCGRLELLGDVRELADVIAAVDS